MQAQSTKQLKQPEGKTDLSHSSVMEKESSGLLLNPESQPKCLLHQTCKTLSIALFKKARFGNDLTALIISGTASQDELNNTWLDIVSEYSSLFKNEDSTYLFELSQQIGAMRAHIAYVDNAVFVLIQKLRYHNETDAEIIAGLINEGYDVTDDISDPEKYAAALNRCVSLCKTNVFDLEQMQNEYDRIEKASSGKKETEDDFDANLIMLSKYQHYPIDEEKTSVYKYALIFNNYVKEHSVKKNKQVTEDA